MRLKKVFFPLTKFQKWKFFILIPLSTPIQYNVFVTIRNNNSIQHIDYSVHKFNVKSMKLEMSLKIFFINLKMFFGSYVAEISGRFIFFLVYYLIVY